MRTETAFTHEKDGGSGDGGTLRAMPRPRQALLEVVVLVVALCSCSSKPDATRPGTSGDAATSAAPAAPAGATSTAPAAPAPAPPPRPKFQIQLRSTPTGAEAAFDGHPAGHTPTTVEIADDGKEHEFTFVLAGYGLERYRTRPIPEWRDPRADEGPARRRREVGSAADAPAR